jgi:hypothetical protein
MLLALGRNIPVVGDVIAAVEGRPPRGANGINAGRGRYGFAPPDRSGGRYEPQF